MASPLEALSEDLLVHVLSFLDARALANTGAAAKSWRGRCLNEELWAALCEAEGMLRDGSSRPGARTFCSWHQTWLNARCAECGATFRYKIALDGGSSSACTWRGAKVALCADCAKLAALHPTAEAPRRLPRLCARFAAEGPMVAIICGRNMRSVLEHRAGGSSR